MMTAAEARPTGALGLQLIRGGLDAPGLGRELSLTEITKSGLPQKGLADEVNDWREDNAQHLLRGWKMVAARAVARRAGLPYLWSQLWLRKTRADGRVLDFGLAGFRVVTTTGVGFLVDAMQGLVEPEDMKYHGFGTGGAAEAVGNTALTTELTTQYATDNVRPTGSLAEGASANIYRTVATLDPDADVAITEHGIFSQASNAGGVLLDRTLFSVVNVAGAGDTLQATYELTFPAGS